MTDRVGPALTVACASILRCAVCVSGVEIGRTADRWDTRRNAPSPILWRDESGAGRVGDRVRIPHSVPYGSDETPKLSSDGAGRVVDRVRIPHPVHYGSDETPDDASERRERSRKSRGQTVESAGRPLRKRRDTNTETIERRSRKEHGSQSAESATRDPRKPRKPETGTAAAKEDENGNGRSVYHGVWVPHTVVHGSLGNQGPAPTPLASDGSGNGRMVDSAPIQHTVHHENRGEPAPPSPRRRTSLPRSCAMQPRSKKRNRLPLRGVECLHIRPHGAVPDE
jgi:hypothetical protein